MLVNFINIVSQVLTCLLDVLSDLNRTPLSYPSNPIQFRTFPDPRLQSGSRLRFIASSCVVPNFPYRGPLHHRTIRGYDLLSKYLDTSTSSINPLDLPQVLPPNTTQEDPFSFEISKHSPPAITDFLLFLGDFIYADVPVYVGDDQEAYRRLYRRNYQSHSFRSVYEKLRKSKPPSIPIVVDNDRSDLLCIR